jgi:hypothetical protein
VVPKIGSGSDAKQLGVKKVWIHPNFDSEIINAARELPYDIAIIKVEIFFNFSNSI